MKRVAIAGLLLLLPACASNEKYVDTWYPHADNSTMGETGDEHLHRVARDNELRKRALEDDLDLLFQTDRPTRLTRWHVR